VYRRPLVNHSSLVLSLQRFNLRFALLLNLLSTNPTDVMGQLDDSANGKLEIIDLSVEQDYFAGHRTDAR
jgi:hypothetical protein